MGEGEEGRRKVGEGEERREKVGEGEERRGKVGKGGEGEERRGKECRRPTLVQGEEHLLSPAQSQTRHQTPLHS